MAMFPLYGAGAASPVHSSPFANPTVAGLTFIGAADSTTERIVGLPVLETPFQSDPKQYVIHVPYEVRVSDFRSLEIDRAGPYGGYHIGESNFKESRAGTLSFWREFAKVPDTRSEFESYVYAYQIATNSSEPDSDSITEIPLTVTSRVQLDYFRTNNPANITLADAPRVININGNNQYLNGWGSAVLGEERLAEDATLRLWKGKIYERQRRFIKARFLDEA